MEWNLKSSPPTGSWDFTEFSNLDNVNNNGPSNTLFKGEFSVDLKLGRVGNSGNEVPKTPAASLPSGSSKRSRGSYNGSQAVSCLVDGCNADLSACRDYHRRHKVCELHSKTSQVSIGGHKQRFCQQCSRFHVLEEFDEGKRSCRKRLDGHNRRRRKPQPAPFSRYGTLLSNYHQGSQLLQFSSSLVYPSTAVTNPSWSNVVVKTEPDSSLQNSVFLNHPTSHSTTTTKPFTLFQGQSTAPELSPLVRAFPVAETDRSSIGKLSFYEKPTTTTTPMQVQNSECALSLLSSTSETGLGHNNNNNNINNNYIDMSDQLSSIPLVHSMGSTHCPGMFHHHHHHHHQLLGCDESSSTINHDSHDHQTFHSQWG